MSAPIEIPLRSVRVLLNLGIVTALAGVGGIALIAGEVTGHHSTGQRVGGTAFGGLLLVAAAVFAFATVVTVGTARWWSTPRDCGGSRATAGGGCAGRNWPRWRSTPANRSATVVGGNAGGCTWC